MNLATLTILAGLALGAVALPATVEEPQQAQQAIAHQTPGAVSRGHDPTFPEKPIDPIWDDTADTSDDLDTLLEVETENEVDVHLETDLNNDVHDPLLEDDTIEPVDILPEGHPERFPVKDIESQDPFKDPLP